MQKRMFLIAFYACLIAMLFPTSAYASKVNLVTGKEANCPMNENVTLNIHFQGIVEKATEVEQKISKIEEQIQSYSKELSIKNVSLNNMNFNLNTNNRYESSGYQFNGNMGFHIESYEKALKLLDILKNKGYQVSLNVNKYKNHCR